MSQGLQVFLKKISGVKKIYVVVNIPQMSFPPKLGKEEKSTLRLRGEEDRKLSWTTEKLFSEKFPL